MEGAGEGGPVVEMVVETWQLWGKVSKHGISFGEGGRVCRKGPTSKPCVVFISGPTSGDANDLRHV